MIYATPAELATYLDPDNPSPVVPSLATVLLRKASELVRDATASARYVTDQTGMPTDLATLTAFKAATMEQAQAWSIHGIDPRMGAAGVPRRVASKALGPAQTSYVADPAADTALSALAGGESLVPAAWAILRNAGLITTAVATVPIEGDRHPIQSVAFDPVTGRTIG